jgi:pilus assembly protein CpaC
MRLKPKRPTAKWLAGLTASAVALSLALPVRTAAGAEGDAAPAAAGKPAKRGKYQRSRLTSDETEATADRRNLLLTTGEDRAVDLKFDANAGANGIAIGNPTVVTTTLVKIGDKRQVVFKPLKAGETTVTVRDNDGTLRLVFAVRVTGSNLLRIAGEIRNLLRDIEGIDIRIVGPKVIVDGEVLVPADYGRLFSVVSDKAYADFVMNLAQLSPLALQVLAKRMQDDINTFAPNARCRVVNGRIFLEGQVDSIDQARRAEKIALLYVPEARPAGLIDRDQTAQRFQIRDGGLIQQFLVVNPAPPKKEVKLVRITVHFVELDKDYSKLFGFKWQPGFTADPTITVGQGANGAAGAAGASFSATISNLLPHLTSLQNAGYARVLKTGTVIVKSGQNASLVEQQEIPFTVQGGNGNVASASAKVGLEVAITPKILGQSEDIEMEMKINQTNAVGRTVAGTAPVTSAHKVDTKLYVKSNESAAIAGVTSSDVGTAFNKDDPQPGAFGANTDPLFTLIHSKNYHKKKSQFVIFVTPQIIENASEGTEDLKKNFRVRAK